MKISIGSDHRGVEQRKIIATEIEANQCTVNDCGTHSTESVDYPDIAETVAKTVASNESERGILICGTGIGVSIAANKINGIRAAVCHNESTAALSRQHNNANVLCMSAGLPESEMRAIIRTWLSTEFEGGRHERRVNKISILER